MNIDYSTADEALQLLQSGHRVFIHTAAATPYPLVEAMTRRAPELRDVEIVSIHTEWDAPYAAPEHATSFKIKVFFVGGNIRKAVQSGRAGYIPMFLSEIPAFLRRGHMPIDVALVQVSPPDRHGFCSLGVSVDVTLAAVETARHVIALVNPNMPRTHGDGLLHVSKIDALVKSEHPIFESRFHAGSETEQAIGRHIAGLVEDGATLQTGIGGIPNAALAALSGHKDLGMHTEMFSDGIIDLVEKGVITGKHKVSHPEKIVSGFCLGTRRLYDFIDDNPMILMCDVGWVNNTVNIRRNPKVTAINSAIEVDLFGQVCADTIGTRQYSGVGGQMDFIRGASLSERGKPIIALPSTTKTGASKIVDTLRPGAGVVTTRAHVHYIVTEFGVAYLYGKTLPERARAMIAIAHPNHREALDRRFFEICHA
ncbi:MAG: acetyl-CoA hydrolase/transferase family protein [Flavobacteriales bacterium]|nr:acetyl-CoA hydrolase/transferase family protein [Flavobacteriales bacterium]